MAESRRASNRERFVRLAEKRVNNTVKSIQLIGNLANKNNYSYAQTDVDKIFRALERELRTAKARFHSGVSDKQSKFSLGD